MPNRALLLQRPNERRRRRDPGGARLHQRPGPGGRHGGLGGRRLPARRSLRRPRCWETSYFSEVVERGVVESARSSAPPTAPWTPSQRYGRPKSRKPWRGHARAVAAGDDLRSDILVRSNDQVTPSGREGSSLTGSTGGKARREPVGEQQRVWQGRTAAFVNQQLGP